MGSKAVPAACAGSPPRDDEMYLISEKNHIWPGLPQTPASASRWRGPGETDESLESSSASSCASSNESSSSLGRIGPGDWAIAVRMSLEVRVGRDTCASPSYTHGSDIDEPCQPRPQRGSTSAAKKNESSMSAGAVGRVWLNRVCVASLDASRCGDTGRGHWDPGGVPADRKNSGFDSGAV